MKTSFKKSAIIALVVLSVVQFSKVAHAELSDIGEVCKKDARCITAGGGAAVGTGLGINSAKQYTKADLFEKENTKIGYEPSKYGEQYKPNELDQYGRLRHVDDGARVTVMYNLNPAENRTYHIQLELAAASSARSDESYHRTMSYSAMKTVHEYNSKGEVTGSHQEPDLLQRLYHSDEASRYANLVIQHETEARLAENPNHPVPTYDLKKVIGADKDVPRQATLDFLEERTQHESTVLKIEVLPKQAKYTLAKMTGKALRTGVAAAIVLTGAAVEAATGYAAKKLNDLPEQLDIKVNIDDFNFTSGTDADIEP